MGPFSVCSATQSSRKYHVYFNLAYFPMNITIETLNHSCKTRHNSRQLKPPTALQINMILYMSQHESDECDVHLRPSSYCFCVSHCGPTSAALLGYATILLSQRQQTSISSGSFAALIGTSHSVLTHGHMQRHSQVTAMFGNG